MNTKCFYQQKFEPSSLFMSHMPSHVMFYNDRENCFLFIIRGFRFVMGKKMK